MRCRVSLLFLVASPSSTRIDLTPSWVWAWYVYVVLSCVDVGRCWTLVPSQLIDPGDLQMHTGDNSCPLSVEILGVFDLLSSFSHWPWQLFFHAKLYPKSKNLMKERILWIGRTSSLSHDSWRLYPPEFRDGWCYITRFLIPKSWLGGG